MKHIERLIQHLPNESVGKIDQFRQTLGENFFPSIAKRMKQLHGNEALDYYPEEVFRLFNAKGEYDINPNDKEALLNKPGVIISNHPGIMDVPLILDQLRMKDGKLRPDLKIYVNNDNYNLYADSLGKEKFLPAVNEGPRSAIIAPLDAAVKHIESGGLFLIFPTGGMDQGKDPKFQFKAGIAYLLKQLKPTDMVFSFGINAAQFSSLVEEKRGALAAVSSIYSLPNLNRVRRKQKISVRGKYSEALEWQNCGESTDTISAQSLAMGDHYLEIYPEAQPVKYNSTK